MMSQNVRFFHTVCLKPQVATFVLCTAVLVAPAQSRCQVAPPIHPEAPRERSVLDEAYRNGYRPTRDLRPAATFGIAVGIQTFGVLTATLCAGVGYHFSDRSIEIGWGTAAAITPAITGAAAWAVGGTSDIYTSPLGAMMTGAYLGAALGYLAVFFTTEKDDPEVDGQYDPIYFGRNNGANVMLNITAYGLAPVLLPAAGAALAHLIMRRPLRHSKRISFGPPSVTVSPKQPGNDAAGINLQLVRATF